MIRFTKITLICLIIISLCAAGVAPGAVVNADASGGAAADTGAAADIMKSVKVILDGSLLKFDVPPAIMDGRTMVPMRVIFEALGADIQWDDKSWTVTATKGGLTVVAAIGNRTMFVNGKETRMDIAPIIVDGRTLVPVRFVSEALDCEVDWDGGTKTVFINSSDFTYDQVPGYSDADRKSAVPATMDGLAGYWRSSLDFSGDSAVYYHFFEGGWLCYFGKDDGLEYEGSWFVNGAKLSRLTFFQKHYNNYNDGEYYIDAFSIKNHVISYIASDPATGYPAVLIDNVKYWKMNKPDAILDSFPVFINHECNLYVDEYKSRTAIYGENPVRYWDEQVIVYSGAVIYDLKIVEVKYADESEDFELFMGDVIFSLGKLTPDSYFVYTTHIPEGMPSEAIIFKDAAGRTYSSFFGYNGKDGSTCAFIYNFK